MAFGVWSFTTGFKRTIFAHAIDGDEQRDTNTMRERNKQHKKKKMPKHSAIANEVS